MTFRDATATRRWGPGGCARIAGGRPEPGERAATELRGSGGRARFLATDVTVEREVEAAFITGASLAIDGAATA